MKPTEPRPTPRRRRWRRFLVCGVLGLNVGIFLGGLFLDEFPPYDADLAPVVPVLTDGPDNPFRWSGNLVLETIERSEAGLAIWFTPSYGIDADFCRQWRGDPELVLSYERLDGWCREYEREFHRLGGNPPKREVAARPSRIQGPLLTEELGLLAKLEFVFGSTERTLHWALFEVRLAQWAVATAQNFNQWTAARRNLDSKLRNIRNWVGQGVLVGVRDLDVGSITANSVPWDRGARFYHRDVVAQVSTTDGLAWFLFSRVPFEEVRAWRWKPVRFRRRHAELVRTAIEEPDAPIRAEEDPRWVRAWIDQYGSQAL